MLRGAPGAGRLPGNAHFTFPGCEGDSLLFLLDLAGVESSTGSACTAGVPRPSHVLLAMGLDEETARGAQRFTLGHASTEEDVDALLAALPGAYARARQAGMAGHESTIQTAGTVAASGRLPAGADPAGRPGSARASAVTGDRAEMRALMAFWGVGGPRPVDAHPGHHPAIAAARMR